MSASDSSPREGEIQVEVEAPGPAGAGDAATALATALAEKKDTYDRYLRAVADLDNLRKRHKRELDDVRIDARFKVLREVVPVVDNLERAVEHATGAEGATGVVDGVRLVLRQLSSAFDKLEIAVVDPMGHPFDPNLHEAISQQESDAVPGTVVAVLQKGYRSGERLMRPAMVVVAKARSQPHPTQDDGTGGEGGAE